MMTTVMLPHGDGNEEIQSGRRAGSPSVVRLGERLIGGGAPCFIVAEAGVNHNGQAELAHRMIEAAAQAGVDAVKFQLFDADTLASAEAPQAPYQAANTGVREPQREMLRRLELPRSVFPELLEHARRLGLTFLVSPFDEGSADYLERLGLTGIKVPSGEITNLRFLGHLARKGIPLLLSTGMSDMNEVAAAVDALRTGGNPPVALFHCVSYYPTEARDVNLRAMQTLRERFRVPVGWSDHTLGTMIAAAAVALGADVIEKHYTLDRGLSGPDHRASLEPQELSELVRVVRSTEAALGDGVKRPVPAEQKTAAVARKSLHAAHDLREGHFLSVEDLVARRPGTGIPPTRLDSLRGRRLRRSLRTGEMMQEEDLG